MDWTTLGVMVAALGALLLFKQLGLVRPTVAQQYLRSGATVIDVRSTQEYQTDHLPNTLNIPLGELRDQIARHVPDRQQVILVHCLSGTRSGIGRRILKNLGYQQVHNLGGYGRTRRILQAR